MAFGGNNPQFSGNCFDDKNYRVVDEDLVPPGSPLLWYAADNIDGTNNSSLNDMDPIGTWVNLGSASSADLTQATSSAKPTYRVDGTDHWVDFDGGDFIKTGTITEISQPYTEILIVGWDALGGSERASDGINLSKRGGMYKGGTNKIVAHAAADLTSSNSVAATTYNSLLCHFNGGSSSLVVNGTTTAGNVGAHVRSGIILGGNVLDSPQLNGRIREVLIYSGDMTADSDLTTYLTAKYGSFPVDF